MYCRLTSIRFSRGRSTPAMRAIRLISSFAPGLALALLVTGVGRADDPHGALALDDLALVANLLDRRADLHDRRLPGLRLPQTKTPPQLPAGPAVRASVPSMANRPNFSGISRIGRELHAALRRR